MREGKVNLIVLIGSSSDFYEKNCKPSDVLKNVIS